MIDTEYLSKALTERFGLEVKAVSSVQNSGQIITISPCGIERTISFRIDLHLGWRTVSAAFIPGNYASGLIAGMKAASPSQRAAFSVFADSLKSKGAQILLELDTKPFEASAPSSWPENWNTIHISMKKVGVVIERASGYDFDATFPWATGFFGLALSLLPLEEIDTWEIVGEMEGGLQSKVVKQYERSRINRAACIEIHGTTCKICGFNFGKRFGELGDGFIHVHHIVPVSEMNGCYTLHPGKDLIPVCPNCHAMLHRSNPALKPEDLIQLL